MNSTTFKHCFQTNCCCFFCFRNCFIDRLSIVQVTRMQPSRWLLGACLWLLCSPGAWAATFKLALIGPWSCDPMFSRAMPTAAANLALSRLRSDTELSRGYWYDVKLLDEDCSTSKGWSSHSWPQPDDEGIQENVVEGHDP